MVKGLGKGLSAIFSDTEEAYENAQSGDESKGVDEIRLDNIYANPNQPRKNFDEASLEELSVSIKEHGVIMPIVVNKEKDGKYMIIAAKGDSAPQRWRDWRAFPRS